MGVSIIVTLCIKIGDIVLIQPGLDSTITGCASGRRVGEVILWRWYSPREVSRIQSIPAQIQFPADAFRAYATLGRALPAVVALRTLLSIEAVESTGLRVAPPRVSQLVTALIQ